jgi:N,N'-diacetyllegionaminate synthase
MVKTFQIGRRRIGPGHPCFVIAEAGVNHNGDLNLARQLVKTAAEAGADAVKFQTFVADRLVTSDAPQAEYQQRNTGVMESQHAMLQRLELSEDAHRELQALCSELGILFLSTPFDEECADFLSDLGISAFKIPSGEITNTPFIRHVARKGVPLIISTGMATLAEIRDAVDTVRDTGNENFALLQCVSAYPSAPEDTNLRAMQTLADAFHVPVGYSDHSEGLEITFAAIALGACIIEKHFTLDRSLPGPDHKASLEPAELAAMVAGIRKIEAALGDGQKRPTAAEAATALVARKSLVAARVLKVGEIFHSSMAVARRPGTGLAPSVIDSLQNRKLARDLAKNEPILLEYFED